MDPQVLNLQKTEPEKQEIVVIEPSFVAQVDGYVKKYFKDEPPVKQIIIETYISQAALRIASVEQKRALEADDGKAAVWLLHQPDGLNHECSEAGYFALEQEATRQGKGRLKRSVSEGILGKKSQGMLASNFAKHLDALQRRL
jgi:hypothetical protein